MLYFEPDIVIHATLMEELRLNGSLEDNQYKELLERTYALLNQQEASSAVYNNCLSAICHIAEAKPESLLVKQLLNDCITASRVFLYRDMLDKHVEGYNSDVVIGLTDVLANAHYALATGTVLTKDQKHLFQQFQDHKRLIISAPTSFGKSRIVSEIIEHNDYENIAIILPTIALLVETFTTLKNKESITNKYNLVNSLLQPLTKRNILILTPERMDLFLDENKSFKIDFFVMDEIYKIQDDDDRKKVFTHCLYRLSRTSADFYLIGPYFDEFSPAFIEKTGSLFRKFETEVVQKDTFDLNSKKAGDSIPIGKKELIYRKGKDTNLKNLIKTIEGQSLVYVGRRDSVESKAALIARSLNDNHENDLIKYIEENIASGWSLANCLRKGVAFHHSGIPRYIQSEIVEDFNNSDIQVIVCSPTLIEGVNTSAKNVIIYDEVKGSKAEGKGIPLTSFDVKNINGRAGRFNVHFIGRAISLVPLPADNDKKSIYFSYFDDYNLDSESVIQIEDVDLIDRNKQRKQEIIINLASHNIPLILVKGNKFIPIHKQIELVEFFRHNLHLMDELFFKVSLPTKDQLGEMIQLCYDYLFTEKDKNRNSFPIWRIIYFTKFYVYNNPTIKEMINKWDAKKIDTKVRNIFTLVSTYFEFALPKYLTAFERIYNFVYAEKVDPLKQISLKYLLTKLEFGFVNPHEIALKEAGIPFHIVDKIAAEFSDCDNLFQIREKYKMNPSLISKLSPFEQKIFKRYV